MPLTPPSLDDRRWEDLVQEGRSLLPLYAPGWTDHNLHDPGITLMELFAWVTEMDLFRADQVPDAHRLRFLALLGIAPQPASGATVPVGLRLEAGEPPLELPAGLVLDAVGTDGEPLQYLTESSLTVLPGTLAVVQSGTSSGFVDQTAAVQRATPFEPFGSDPLPGDALYLGFSEPPAAGGPLTLHFELEGGGAAERQRILERLEEARRCGPPRVCCCEDGKPCACDEALIEDRDASPPDLAHPAVRLAWEVALAPGLWRELDPAAGEIEDGTRSLTLSGRVMLRPPFAAAPVAIDESETALPTLRCRLAYGAYDAAPEVTAVLANAVLACQEIPAGPHSFVVRSDAMIDGELPSVGRSMRFDAELDADGKILHLIGGADGAELFVLGWTPPGVDTDGELVVEAVALDQSTGRPHQALDLSRLIPAGERLVLVSEERGRWRRWRRQADFDASTRSDADFVVEPEPGDRDGLPMTQVRFGDGERGRTPSEGASVWAAYDATAGSAGKIAAGGFTGLADGARNRALLASHPGGFDDVAPRLDAVENPLSSTGGHDGESVTEAARRALETATAVVRAVTLGDLESIALTTPGSRLARAEARAELSADLPCYSAPGVVTVLILPHLPAGRPVPSASTLTAVSAYLGRRRTLGTRIEVAGPTYVEVQVRAHVEACTGVDPAALKERLRASLTALFHPLTGSPAGTGWPFGRTVYATEVYQALDETEGADHVTSLELIKGDGEPTCGNLCLPPTGLVDEGDHELTVTGGSPKC